MKPTACLLVALFLASCSTPDVKAPEPIPYSASTPGILLPSAMPNTETPTTSPAPTPRSGTGNRGFIDREVEIQARSLNQVDLPGALVLNNRDAHLLCLETMASAILPTGDWLVRYSPQAVSPHGAYFAYVDPRLKGALHLVTPTGSVQAVPDWEIGPFWSIIGWLGPQTVALTQDLTPPGTVFLYNVIDGRLSRLEPPFPEISDNGALHATDRDALAPFAIYDPRLERVLVERFNEYQGGAYELWDVQTATLLWTSPGSRGSRPVWSPDASLFAVDSVLSVAPDSLDETKTLRVLDRSGFELIRIDRFGGPVAWSHIGNSIAGQWAYPSECTEPCPSQVALHSVESGLTTLFKIASDASGPLDQYPVWSPDSTMLAFNTGVLDEEFYFGDPNVVEIVILDLVNEVAWRIASESWVLGWIAACPEAAR